jgi:hypothetical protein
MSDAIITLAEIVDKALDTYNTNEGWVVKRMSSKYVNRIVANLLIIYQKDKVQYFSNKFAMMISKADHGMFVYWVVIFYSQLVKELIKPLNPTHISPKKEKQPETRTTKKVVMMFQFDDDEERETL